MSLFGSLSTFKRIPSKSFPVSTLSKSFSTSLVTAKMQPLQLFSGPTPNGFKPQIMLEELKRAYPDFKYEVKSIDIMKNTQKEDWFLKMNPNGRIPVLVDLNDTFKDPSGYAVMESGAILLYLAQIYDKEHKFSFAPEDVQNYNDQLQWLFFQNAGIGPMQGQLNHFRMQHNNGNTIPYAIKRYRDETLRLYGVLDMRLKDRDFLAGDGRGKYSIADMTTSGWVFCHGFSGIKKSQVPGNVQRWLKANLDREAMQFAVRNPTLPDYVKNILDDPDYAAELPDVD